MPRAHATCLLMLHLVICLVLPLGAPWLTGGVCLTPLHAANGALGTTECTHNTKFCLLPLLLYTPCCCSLLLLLLYTMRFES